MSTVEKGSRRGLGKKVLPTPISLHRFVMLPKMLILVGILNKCTNLTSLDLSDNHYVSSLSRLTALTYLDISRTTSYRARSLSLLTNLTVLMANNTKISDRAVRLLTNLRTLHASGCPKITLDSLSLLSNLTNCSIDARNLPALREMTELRHLAVSKGIAYDFVHVTHLGQLESLDLPFAPDTLSHLNNLSCLRLVCFSYI